MTTTHIANLGQEGQACFKSTHAEVQYLTRPTICHRRKGGWIRDSASISAPDGFDVVRIGVVAIVKTQPAS
jgi:hypothetical protein